MSSIAAVNPVRPLITAAALVVCSAAAACSSASQYFDVKPATQTSVSASSEDLRITVIGQRQEVDEGGTTHTRTVTCVEPVGPAMLLQNLSANGAISAVGLTTVSASGKGSVATDGGTQGSLQGGGATSASTDIRGSGAIDVTQALAQIYQVGEIIQLVQTMSFNYCEAFANGTLTADEYVGAMDSLQDRAEALLRLQMTSQAEAAILSETGSKAAAEAASADAQAKCKSALGAAWLEGVCQSASAFDSAFKPQSVKGGIHVNGLEPPVTARESARAAALEVEAANSRAAASSGRIQTLQGILGQIRGKSVPSTAQAGVDTAAARAAKHSTPMPAPPAAASSTLPMTPTPASSGH
jgi:hypothetical protein